MFLTDFKEELKKRNEQKLTSLLVSQFTSEFINYSQTIHTAKTVKAYKLSLNFFKKYFGDILINNITNGHMIKYFENRISSSSIYQARKDLICLHSCFNYAVKQNIIKENPCNGIKRFKIPDKQPLFFSEVEFELLLGVIDNCEIKDLVRFAVNTGLRQMELLTLEWNQISFKDKYLILDNRNNLTKSKKIRTVPLNLTALQIITERQILSKGQLVFTLNGNPIKQNYISKKFNNYIITAKLNPKLNFHSLRHTFASWLVQKGVSIYTISHLLGHSDIKVTEIYSHLRAEDLMNSVNKLNN